MLSARDEGSELKCICIQEKHFLLEFCTLLILSNSLCPVYFLGGERLYFSSSCTLPSPHYFICCFSFLFFFSFLPTALAFLQILSHIAFILGDIHISLSLLKNIFTRLFHQHLHSHGNKFHAALAVTLLSMQILHVQNSNTRTNPPLNTTAATRFAPFVTTAHVKKNLTIKRGTCLQE